MSPFGAAAAGSGQFITAGYGQRRRPPSASPISTAGSRVLRDRHPRCATPATGAARCGTRRRVVGRRTFSVLTDCFRGEGGPGHRPYEVAEWATSLMTEQLGFTVEGTTDPFRLEDDLTGYDLIVFGWTQALTTEDMTDKQERSLLHAVSTGTGVAGWHGMTGRACPTTSSPVPPSSSTLVARPSPSRSR